MLRTGRKRPRPPMAGSFGVVGAPLRHTRVRGRRLPSGCYAKLPLGPRGPSSCSLFGLAGEGSGRGAGGAPGCSRRLRRWRAFWGRRLVAGPGGPRLEAAPAGPHGRPWWRRSAGAASTASVARSESHSVRVEVLPVPAAVGLTGAPVFIGSALQSQPGGLRLHDLSRRRAEADSDAVRRFRGGQA